MSFEPAVSCRDLGKRYDVYQKPHHRLLELVGGGARARSFWALRHVSLNVMPGETVGIVGRNGSGKSTLLQMLCGTLEPTEGELQVRGRVAALLELGAGFNPEFTGRENALLNGTLLGMSSEEIEKCMPAILEFADIGEFIDQPVRTYSSGMYVRLAFAVAISVEPDVLVVDEALAVGDEAFQRKCYARIDELKAKGTAILFVSHAASAIVQLCDRAILMEAGEMWAEGEPKDIIAGYHKVLYSPPEKRAVVMEELRGKSFVPQGLEAVAGARTADPAGVALVDVSMAEQPASHERFDADLVPKSTLSYESRGALIESPEVLNSEGRVVNVLSPGKIYRYRFQVRFESAAQQVHFGMLIKSTAGVELFGLASHAHGEGIDQVPAGEVLCVEFRFRASMLPGAYFINAGCVGFLPGEGETYLHRLLDAVMFRVESTRIANRMSGFFDLAEDPPCRVSEVQRRD